MSSAGIAPTRVPVLGVLSPVARAVVLATLAASVAAVVLDLGLGAEGAVVFVVSAIAILGLAWVVGLSTERLGALDGESNWLEGALLMLVYLVLAISFFELRVPI